MKRISVFVSYSRKDKKWLDLLLVHLKFLEHRYSFSIWVDEAIKPGSDWKAEIANALDSAKVAILLVSAHYLSSDFINTEELPSLLKAAKEEGATILPLIVSHCMFAETEPLSQFQSVNHPTKPLTEMLEGERDALFVNVTKVTMNALVDEISVKTVPNRRAKANSANIEHELRYSLARICVLSILHKKTGKSVGYTVSEIYKLSGLKSRKKVFESIQEMENSGLVEREKMGNNTYWRLSDKGESIAQEFHEILLPNFT